MNIHEYIQALEDALDNFLGITDTPVGRRHFSGSLENETMAIGREIQSHPRPTIRLQDAELSITEANALGALGWDTKGWDDVEIGKS